MKDKSTVFDRALVVVCMGFLCIVLLTICVRFFTKNITVEYFGIRNDITEMILADMTPPAEATQKLPNSKNAYEKIVYKIQDLANVYTNNYLVAYNSIVDISKIYKKKIGWNYAAYSEYNGIWKYGDNYFYWVYPKGNVTETSEALIGLSQYCAENGAEFLYVSIPDKISKYEDTGISGVTDFTNQNADALLEKLNAAGVHTYDLREEIVADGLKHHDLFYDTDHHWKTETGLWAAKKILTELQSMGYDTDPSVLEPDNFDYVVYPKWFLGSQGKKVGLRIATPEDFTMIYPKTETLFHYEIPSENIDAEVDFAGTYNMSNIEICDYVNKSPYHAYTYGDVAILKMQNLLTENDDKVLLIRNSYCDCVVPFLAMGLANLEALDLRHFTDSVQEYIQQTQPDIVIVAYHGVNATYSINYSTHTDPFDFR